MSCVFNMEATQRLRLTMGIVHVIIALAASIGNLTIFTIVIKNNRLHTRSTISLMSLAVTDFLVGIIVEPMHISQLFSVRMRNDCEMNEIRRKMYSIILAASVNSLALISYDRYIHLTKHVNYRRYMTKKKIALLTAFTWAMALIVLLFRTINIMVDTIVAITHILLGQCVMITCYIVIFITARNQRRRVSPMLVHRSQREEIRRHSRAARAIIIIIAVTIVTYLPIALFYVYMVISPLLSKSPTVSSEARETGYLVTLTIAMSCSAINPLIYYLRIPEFKTSLRRILEVSVPKSAVRSSNETRMAVICHN